MLIGIVAPTAEPYVRGGAERLWDTLKFALEQRGHQCELVTIPFPEANLRQVLGGYQAFSDLDVSRYDVVVSGKYPAWMISHPRHLVYMLHPLRGLYDTYPALGELSDTAEGRAVVDRLTGSIEPEALIEAGLGVLDELGPNDPLASFPGPLARWLVQKLDSLALAPGRVHRYAAISEEVAARPGYFPDQASVLVAHPQSDLAPATIPTSGITTYFTASRHDRPKRLDLIIGAFSTIVDASARLVIAGDGPDRVRLEQQAAGDPRVSFVGRLSDEQLADCYASATAVVFCPEAEDFGYISLEALASGTPVVTTYDSGGARELIEHGVNGMIVEPTPDAIAWAMSHVASSPFERWQLGLNARRTAAAVRWDHLLDDIVGLRDSAKRPQALVLSTYGVEPALGGGQRRIRNLDRALATVADVTVLVLSSRTPVDRRRRLEPGIDQIEIARSPAQIEAEEDIFDLLELPVDDLTIGRLADATPAFGLELSKQLEANDVVIASQPFLVPTLPDNVEMPLIHDSQNAEFQMKAALLPSTAVGNWLLEQGVKAEAMATNRAALVVACTDTDLAALSSSADASPPGIVIPNGVDTGAIPQRTAEQQRIARKEILAIAGFDADDNRPLGVFIGSWHPPNIEAGRIVLELARRRPDWIFVLAGSHTSSYAETPLPDNVHLIAIFSETLLWPMLAAADVALNPMVSGGGSNLKLFDYLAVGVPIVATETGARGLENPGDFVELVDDDGLDLPAALDRAIDPGPKATARRKAGRQLVEDIFDWRQLGKRWTEAVLNAADLEPGPIRQTTTITTPPLLAETDPPPADPVVAAMESMGAAARSEDPQPLDTTMDPVVRELLTKASDNRHVGRVLPDEARLKLPKQALIRVGQAISNEQLAYNETVLDILEHLSIKVDALRTENEALVARIQELESDQLNSGRRDAS